MFALQSSLTMLKCPEVFCTQKKQERRSGEKNITFSFFEIWLDNCFYLKEHDVLKSWYCRFKETEITGFLLLYIFLKIKPVL